MVVSALPFGEVFLCPITRLDRKGREAQEAGCEGFKDSGVSGLISEKVLVCPSLGPAEKTVCSQRGPGVPTIHYIQQTGGRD